jgi:hypothetical protein
MKNKKLKLISIIKNQFEKAAKSIGKANIRIKYEFSIFAKYVSSNAVNKKKTRFLICK